MIKFKSVLFAGAALALAGTPAVAAGVLNVSLANTSILASTPAVVSTNALSSAPQTGTGLTVDVASGRDIAAVTGSPLGTPTQLQPVVSALALLNPPVQATVKGVAVTIAATTAGLTTALSPLTRQLQVINPPIQALVGGLSGVTSGNSASSLLSSSGLQAPGLGNPLGGVLH